MELDKVYYCCELCRGEMHVYVRDVGFYPDNVPCVKCEGTAILNFNRSNEIPPSFRLIRPKLDEWFKYRNIEEARWSKLGFSKIECSYLFEHDIEFIKKGGLILVNF